MQHLSRRFVAVGIVGAVILASAGIAYAGSITTPSTNPFAVPGDANGVPQPFTVVATGFTPGQQVFLEQCDGNSPTMQGWDPTLFCDNGASNAPVLADSTGAATFTAPGQHEFFPVKGVQPSGEFACVGPSDPPITGLADGSWTNCQLRVSSNNAAKTTDQLFMTLIMPNTPVATTTTTSSTTTSSTTTSTTSTSTTSTTSTTTTTVPTGGIKKTDLGTCSGLNALASLKTSTGTGINNTNQQAKISIKSINAPTCTGTVATSGTVDPSSFKASLSGMSVTCNQSLAPLPNTLPPSGKFGFSQASGAVKQQGYLRITKNDPAINFFADVISVHGIMTKGPLAGADVDGTLSQDPTVKDKTTGAPAYGAFTGVDVNPIDSAQIGASCVSGTSSGSLLFNSGLGGKVAVPVPTAITMTMVADGTSLLEAAGFAPPANTGMPGVAASGLHFSAF